MRTGTLLYSLNLMLTKYPECRETLNASMCAVARNVTLEAENEELKEQIKKLRTICGYEN